MLDKKNKHNYERCTYVSRLLERTNFHTQWCTHVAVTNSDSQTIKKQKPLAKKYWLTKYVKTIVIKLLIFEWQNPHNLQWDWNLQHNQKHVVDCYGDSKVEITEQLIMIKKTKKAGSNHRLKSQVSCSCTAC